MILDLAKDDLEQLEKCLGFLDTLIARDIVVTPSKRIKK